MLMMRDLGSRSGDKKLGLSFFAKKYARRNVIWKVWIL